VVRRRLAHDDDPAAFAARWADEEAAVRARIVAARELLPSVRLGDGALRQIAATCAAFEVDGMRGDLVMARTATALAAWAGRTDVTEEDVRQAALLALPHRRRRNPFDAPGLDEDKLDETLQEHAGSDEDEDGGGAGGGDDDPGPDGGGDGGGQPPQDPPPEGGPQPEAAPPEQPQGGQEQPGPSPAEGRHGGDGDEQGGEPGAPAPE